MHSQKHAARIWAVLATLALIGAAFLLLLTAGRLQENRRENARLLRENLQQQGELARQQEAGEALQQELDRCRQDIQDLQLLASQLKSRGDLLDTRLREAQAAMEDKEQQLRDLEQLCAQLQQPSADPEVLAYQALYPDLYVAAPDAPYSAEGKVAYLTFDDGPSDRTDEVLAILKRYDVPATFFVVPRDTPESNRRLRAIADAGHAIGVHTATHNYRKIYADVESFLDDFSLAFRRVEKATGLRPDIFRFPGGSVNSYNKELYQPLIAEMLRRGFVYYDWNAGGDDAGGQTTAAGILRRTKETAGYSRLFLLYHDAEDKKGTVGALPDIIEYLQQQGYRFEKLDHNVRPVTFAYGK